MPYFSIVIPTYNRAHLITKTLDSIKAQTFSDFEVLIIDDGSTDNTESVVKPYLNEQFQYYKKTNAERAAARNYGTKLAKGEYINWFDSDDLALPNHLEVAYQKSYNLKPACFHLGYALVSPDDRIISNMKTFPNPINSILHKGNVLSCNGVFVKMEIALNNQFNETRILSASEDFELWLRLAAQFPIIHINEITSYIVQHDERSVLTMNNAQKLIDRFETFNHLIKNNNLVANYFGKKLSFLMMKNYLWLAVDLAFHGHKKLAIKYLVKALKTNPACLNQKSFYATLKHLLIK